jgi:ABC-type Co2+ transport system permease subunit
MASYVLVAHVFIIIIEAVVVGSCASYLARVKPEILAGQVAETPASASTG